MKFYYYNVSGIEGKMFIVGNICGYKKVNNYNGKYDYFFDSYEIEKLYNCKFSISYFLRQKYFRIPKDTNYNLINSSKKEIKNYLQTKKFNVSFENHLTGE